MSTEGCHFEPALTGPQGMTRGTWAMERAEKSRLGAETKGATEMLEHPHQACLSLLYLGSKEYTLILSLNRTSLALS